MGRKSHYRILGITRAASDAGIREAYLRLVKALHPDHAGVSSTQAFREVQQAYDVLSDPERKKSYDDQLDRKRPARVWGAEPLTRYDRVEPLVPDRPLMQRPRTSPGIIFDESMTPISTEFFSVGGTSTTSAMVVDLDVWVSTDQAAQGGVFDGEVVARATCGTCAGTGYDWPFPCLTCRQSGWVSRSKRLRLHLPPGVLHGTVVHLPAHRTGGAELRIRLLIDGRMRAPPIW